MPNRRADMISAAIGLLLVGTLLTGFLAWRAVGNLDESLSQAGSSLQAIDETLAVTETLLTDTAAALVLLDTTFGHLETASESSTTAVTDAAALAATVPQNLRDVQTGLSQTEAAAITIDEITKQLGTIPLIGGGIEETTLAPTIAQLSTNLDPLIVSMEASSLSLSTLAVDAGVLTDDLPILRAQLAVLQTDLTDGATSVADLRASTFGDNLTQQTISLQTGLLRLLIVVGTLSFAGTQLLMLVVLRRLEHVEFTAKIAGNHKDLPTQATP